MTTAQRRLQKRDIGRMIYAWQDMGIDAKIIRRQQWSMNTEHEQWNRNRSIRTITRIVIKGEEMTYGEFAKRYAHLEALENASTLEALENETGKQMDGTK
jgi:hypothetical protein